MQPELFDGFIRYKACRRCGRRLHTDQLRRFRTRQAGLCHVCLAEYERRTGWSIEEFLRESSDADLRTVRR